MMCYVLTIQENFEVFKTNVCDPSDAKRMVELLREQFPHTRINFDLHDCDKILRMQGPGFTIEKVMMFVKKHGFDCCPLD
jgi:hypothetical protein